MRNFLRCDTRLRGLSILGVVLTLAVLAALTAVLPVLVATNQMTRTHQLYIDQAFYSAQAAFEYALRQIKVEGDCNPLPVRQFANNTWVISRVGGRIISTTATYGTAVATFSIVDPSPPADSKWLTVDTSAAGINQSDKKLEGLTITKGLNCGNSITIVSMTISWSPDNGHKVKQIHIDNTQVYNSPSGLSSGSTFVFDSVVTLNDTNPHDINFIKWNNLPNGSVTFNLGFNLSDGTTKTVVFSAS